MSQETTTSATAGGSMAAGIFCLLFYLCVWLAVDPRLIYHGLGIFTPYQPFFFHTDWTFFLEHLTKVGGVASYGTRLLSQFYAFGWAGALVVAAAACCTVFFVRGLIRRGGGRIGLVLPCVPAAILLVMYCAYSHPLNMILTLLAALASHSIYIHYASKSTAWRITTLVLVYPILYHAVGPGSLLFAVLVAIDSLLIEGRARLAAVALGISLVVPWAASVITGIGLAEAYKGFLDSVPGVKPEQWSHTLALYLFFPTALAGSALWGRASGQRASHSALVTPKLAESPRRHGHSAVQSTRPVQVRPVAEWLRAAAFFIGVGAVAWLSLDSLTKSVLETDYYAQQGRWSEVLRSAGRMPKGIYNHRCNRNVMQALCHTGRLGDEMFRYPQQRVDLFSTPKEHEDLGSCFQESRLFLDVGLVNQAERSACEALAILGEKPAILEQLATIHVVKGRPEAAKVFLKALAKHPFHRRSAEDMLRRLEADPTLKRDRLVSHIRSNMPSQDSVVQLTNVEDWLIALLEKNPHNRMAFELLMAHYLCDKRPDMVVANLPRLKAFSCTRIPRYYQEAVVAHARSRGLAPLASGSEIDPEVLRRAEDFFRLMACAANREEALTAVVDAGLGDSYFFYLTCGVSGW